MRKKVVRFK